MLTGFIRAIILYLLIIAGIRLMGKRQVGELEPSELVLSLIIADLAAVPMQDFGIPLLAGIIPILTLLALTMMLSVLTMKCVAFRTLLCGRPSVIIRRGTIDQGEMRRNRLTVDELLEELRAPGWHTPFWRPTGSCPSSPGSGSSPPSGGSWEWRPGSPACPWCSSATGGSCPRTSPPADAAGPGSSGSSGGGDCRGRSRCFS